MGFLARLGLVLATTCGGAAGADAQVLTAQQQDRLFTDPAAFLEAAATATHWFGDPRGLNAQGVLDFVAAMRAGRRADVTALLLQADLSDDGIVSQDEVLRLAPALTPSARGKLIARAGLADGDSDGAVSPAELQAYARDEALRLFPDQKAQDLQMVLLFDTDGDTWVAYDEVVQALKDLNGAQVAARPRRCKGAACVPAPTVGHHLSAAVLPLVLPPGSPKAAPVFASDAP